MNYGPLCNKMTDELRRRLDLMEELENGVRRVWIGRKYLADQERRKESGQPYNSATAFDVPSLCTWRPVTSDGRTSFHFSLRPVSKPKSKAALAAAAAVLKAHGEKKPKEKSPKSAAAFEDYVSREATADAVDFESYISRQGSSQSPSHIAGFVISNISPEKQKRVEYWKAVAKRERIPGEDKYRLSLAVVSALPVAGLAADLGPELHRQCQVYLARREAGLPTDKTVVISQEQYFSIKAALSDKKLWNWKKPAVFVSPSRGGRVQYRAETEFPAELADDACVRIAKELAAELNGLGVMFTIAIHMPDGHNDGRNRHLHLIFHDRPAKWLEDKGCWDFDYEVPKPGQRRTYFPERQPKIRLVSAATDWAADDAKKNFPAMLRAGWATLCNRELELAGATLRFDPRSYKQLGLDCLPGEHLGSKATMLELRGIPTETGISNAEKRWNAKIQSDRALLNARQAARQELIDRANGALIQLQISNAAQSARNELAGRLVCYQALSDSLDRQAPDVIRFDQHWEMATSRARKTLVYAQQRNPSAASPDMSKAKIDELADLLERASQAENHINDVYSVVGGEAEVKAVWAAYNRELRDAYRLSNEIEHLIEQVPNVIAAARSAASQTAPRTEPLVARLAPPVPAQIADVTLEDVMKRVHSEHLPILPPDEAGKGFRVPKLTRAEVECLRSSGSRAQDRLAAIHRSRQPTLPDVAPPLAPEVADGFSREPSPVAVLSDKEAKPKATYEEMLAEATAKDAAKFQADFDAWLNRMRNLSRLPIALDGGRSWDFSEATEADRYFGEHACDRPQMKHAQERLRTEVCAEIIRTVMQFGPKALNRVTGKLDVQIFPERVRPFVRGFEQTDQLVRHAVSSRCGVLTGQLVTVPAQVPKTITPTAAALLPKRVYSSPQSAMAPQVHAAWLASRGISR